MSDDVAKSYHAGSIGALYTGTTSEEFAAYQAGQATRPSAKPAAPGTGGAVLALPVLVLLALPALVVGVCLYPVPGLLTLVGTSIIAGFLPDNVAFLVVLVVVLVPGIAIFAFSMALERKLETSPLYWKIRHVLRLLVVGFVAHVIAFAFNGAGTFGASVSVLDRISLVHVLVVVAAVGTAHVLFKRRADKPSFVETVMARFRGARA
jgi:hypothetical protein